MWKKGVDPARNLLWNYFAQCVHRIGAFLVGRSAAPMGGCGYSPLALHEDFDGRFLTGVDKLILVE